MSDDIEKLLRLGGMASDLAAVRAHHVEEFFHRTRLAPEFREVSFYGVCPPQIEFVTGDKQWSVGNADVLSFNIVLPPNKLPWVGGTWLETAPLVYLAKVCEIGRNVLGEQWPGKFLTRLRNACELLDVLNEVWWLGRWTALSRITRAHRMHLEMGSQEDVDWRFFHPAARLWVNLEVKRRRNDILRAIYPAEELRAINGGNSTKGLFDKLADSFAASREDEVNVAAVTIYGGVTADVKRAIDDWFRSDQSRHVDVIALWSVGSTKQHFEAWFVRSRKHRGFLESILFPPDTEDLSYCSNFVYPRSVFEALSEHE